MTILYTLLEITIYSAVIYCAIMLFRQVFQKNTSPVLIYMVWFLLIARLMIPVTPDAGFSFFTIPAQQIQAAAADTAAVSPEGSEPLINEDQIVSFPTGASPDTVPDQAANPARGNAGLLGDSASQTSLPSGSRAGLSLDLPSILLLIWISGIALGIFHLSLASVRLKKRLLCRSISAEPGITALSDTIKSELRLRAGIKIVVLSDIASPALTAGFRPAVLIPLSLAAQSTGQLEFALRHELMHYKRKDHIVCLLLAVLRAVYWFNPIVWLTARQMKMDMETACDSMVVASMSGDRKRSYANTILNMYAGEKKTRLLMGMALENTKKTAERRIRGIFMPSRSKRRTKAAAICLAAVLLIACFTTACQPVTPESGNIPGSSTPLPSQSQKIQSGSSSLPSYEAPSSYRDEFKAKDGRVSVSIDADVAKPDAAQIPVLQLTPQDISVDWIKKAAGILMEGKTLYEPRTALTKTELQEQIDALQKILDDPTGSRVEGLNYNDPNIAVSAADELRYKLDTYRLLYQDAPDAYTLKEAEFQFHNTAYYYEPAAADTAGTASDSGGEPAASASAAAVASPAPDGDATGEDETGSIEDRRKNDKIMIVQADLDSGYYGDITAYNYAGKNTKYNSFYFYKSRFMNIFGNVTMPDQDIFNQPCTITQDEAYRMALDLLEKLGITDMTLNTCRPAGFLGQPVKQASKDVYGYYVEFVRTYNRIPLISFSGDYNSLVQEYDHPGYMYESVSIMIHEDQITSFSWVSPSGPTQIIDQDSSLLPFDRVIEIFKTQISDVYDAEKLVQVHYYNTEYKVDADYNQILKGIQSGQITISKIELGYVRTEYEAQPGSYRLVPAWKFYGSDQVTSLVNGAANVYPGRLPNAVNTYMTINAVDGSILDGKPD